MNYTDLIRFINITLHSNLVLFKYKTGCSFTQLQAVFTFQSGSIQMNINRVFALVELPLHSNLVLFKLIYAASGTYVCSVFTFQSGSIQIYLKCQTKA